MKRAREAITVIGVGLPQSLGHGRPLILGLAVLLCEAALVGCSGGSDEMGMGPEVPIGTSVTTDTARIEVVAARCSKARCLVLQRVTPLGPGDEPVHWTEHLIDSTGQEWWSGNAGYGVDMFMEDIPQGVTAPTFAEFVFDDFTRFDGAQSAGEMPADARIVGLTINGQRVPITPVDLTAEPVPEWSWQQGMGAAVPIGETILAHTAYGPFSIEFDSFRCSPTACEISQQAVALDAGDQDYRWSQYPLWQQELVDSEGTRHAPPPMWLAPPPNWPVSFDAGFKSAFTVVYELPPDRQAVAIAIPGADSMVTLPTSGDR